MAESLDRMVTAIPRLRQRVEPADRGRVWVDVEHVDLGRPLLERQLGGLGRRR